MKVWFLIKEWNKIAISTVEWWTIQKDTFDIFADNLDEWEMQRGCEPDWQSVRCTKIWG